MLKNTKNIIIFTIASFYVLQLFFVFSGVLINYIQEVRYQLSISQSLLIENKEIEISEWNLLENQKEIKIDGVFYDVKSYKTDSKKVHLVLIKDATESNFRIIIQSLFKKSKLPLKDKKKHLVQYHYIPLVKPISQHYLPFLIFKIKKIESYFVNKKTSLLDLSRIKPPIFILFRLV
jgi:hypothetical protein